MQSISRFLAVLIALIFLIGPLAGSAAAHEAEDGDHEDATYGSLSLTRLDDLGDTVYVNQILQFGVAFTQADADHLVPSGIGGGDDTAIALMGTLGNNAPNGLTVGGAGRTISYTVQTEDMAGATSRSVTLFVQYTYTPDGPIEEGGDNHPAQPVKSNEITITVLPALETVVTLSKLELSDGTLDPPFVADSDPVDNITAMR